MLDRSKVLKGLATAAALLVALGVSLLMLSGDDLDLGDSPPDRRIQPARLPHIGRVRPVFGGETDGTTNSGSSFPYVSVSSQAYLCRFSA